MAVARGTEKLSGSTCGMLRSVLGPDPSRFCAGTRGHDSGRARSAICASRRENVAHARSISLGPVTMVSKLKQGGQGWRLSRGALEPAHEPAVVVRVRTARTVRTVCACGGGAGSKGRGECGVDSAKRESPAKQENFCSWFGP